LLSVNAMRLTKLLALLAILTAACGSDSSAPGGDGDGGPLGGALAVHGTVVDFESGAAVTGAASVSVSGLSPAPTISTTGADFTITGVPANSAFHILAASPPDHRATYSPAVEVVTSDVSGVKAFTVSETYLAALATAFGVNPAAGRGVLLAQVVDDTGAAVEGVAGTSLAIDGGGSVAGPFFLDAQRMPDAGASKTSASGWVVWFELDPGLTEVTAAAGENLTVAMPRSPVGAGAVTIASIVVKTGATSPPTNVSFSGQIIPIFQRRGCQACHSGGGPGKDLGNLTLDGSGNLIYRELTVEQATNPGMRVNVADPANSLVLTMPSREDPPDAHPNVTFSGPSDPDYMLLLAWITEGAKQN
jgi:hypothetical protein